MVGQRRGEFGGHARRSLGGAFLAALLLTLSACDAGIRVTGFGTTGGGTGGTGGGSGSGALVGAWRNLSSLPLSDGGTLILDVRWIFDASNGCARTRIETVIRGNTGSETTETIPCTYVLTGSSVTVTFQGSSVPSRFSVSFAGSDLLLAGTRFQRIG